MKRMHWLSLLVASGLLATLGGCETTTSELGADGDTRNGRECPTEGATERAADGCNTCTCSSGVWNCTELGCSQGCENGETRLAVDGCNTCTCAGGNWACTLMYCEEPTTCEPGDTQRAADGCNTCSCGPDGTWACTEMDCAAECVDGEVRAAGCNTCSCEGGQWLCSSMPCVDPCTEGDTRPADDGCNTCSCQADGTWACTQMACGCTEGETRRADCNSCTCQANGTWACTTMACAECAPGDVRLADDGCNTQTCDDTGFWGPPTERACECVNGESRPADDGCNTCSCTDGRWLCTLEACSECTPGDTRLADDGCNTQTCNDAGFWGAPTERLCECTEGETRPADDGCNSCGCADGMWVCTEMACAECPAPAPQDPLVGCIDVVVWSKDPTSGLCCEYGTPCDAPLDWPQYYSMETCEAAPLCPAPLEVTIACEEVVVWAKDPVSGGCCQYGTPCIAPAGWSQFGDQDSCESAPDGVFVCGNATRCITGEEYCLETSGGPQGSETTFECAAFEPNCNSCDCLGADLEFCDCSELAGTTSVLCAMP